MEGCGHSPLQKSWEDKYQYMKSLTLLETMQKHNFFSFSNISLLCVYPDLPLMAVFLYQAYG